MRMSTAVASDYLKAWREGFCPIAGTLHIARRPPLLYPAGHPPPTSRRRIITPIAPPVHSGIPHNYLSPSAIAGTDNLFYALITRAAIGVPAIVSLVRASGLPMSS